MMKILDMVFLGVKDLLYNQEVAWQADPLH